MKITCPFCNHTWNYKGKLQTATCPSCLNKVKVPQVGEDISEGEDGGKKATRPIEEGV